MEEEQKVLVNITNIVRKCLNAVLKQGEYFWQKPRSAKFKNSNKKNKSFIYFGMSHLTQYCQLITKKKEENNNFA